MPTNQELPPAENETTSRDPSSISHNLTHNTDTNKHETEPNQDPHQIVPQAQNEPTSTNTPSPQTGVNSPKENDTGTSKQDFANEADPCRQETRPVENETSKDSDNTNQAEETRTPEKTHDSETLKEDTVAAEVEKTSINDSEHEVSSTDKQEAGDLKTSIPDSDPRAQETQQAKNETASPGTPHPEDNLPQTTEIGNNQSEDTEASKRDSATMVDPQATAIETAAISEEPSPPKDDAVQSTHNRNQEADRTAAPEDDTVATNNFPTQLISTSEPEKDPNQESAMNKEISPQEKRDTINRDSSFTNAFSNGADSHRKKWWVWLQRLLKGRKDSPPKSSSVSKASDKTETSIKSPSELSVVPNLIQADIDSVDKETKELEEYNERLRKLNEDAKEESKSKNVNYRELRKSMIKLRLLIPSKSDIDSDAFKSLQLRLKSRESISKDLLEKMPQLHNNDIFYSSQEFKDFKARYDELDFKLKLALLCFSIFPGNCTIRKRLMVRWWVAEGLASEVKATEYFLEFTKRGFIVPVNENRGLSIKLYRMHPLYQSMLKMLAQRAKFFNFDKNGKPTQNYANTFQACLVGDGLVSYDDLKNNLVSVDGLEKIHLVMNVEEPILDFKPEWFSNLRNVNIMYLGRWQTSDAAHIEVEDTNFLDELKSMNYIKFLSLQGISNIIKLTESILALSKLEFLDLRACHNLEVIPQQVGLLKSLTHLDMSECYLLEHMPKSLSSLMNLRVLKGFVVGYKNLKSCTLADLRKLKNLTKLCIYTTLKHFPDKIHVSSLQQLSELRKLTISWGGGALHGAIEETKGGMERLPSKLEKLDLKCYPLKTTPSWLDVGNLQHLKKLYVRGGRFSDLGQYQEDDGLGQKNVWNVERLRLKYLSNIELEWRQLHELFPKLVYFEQVSCPMLNLFGCGARGVWINDTKLKDLARKEDQFSEWGGA